MCDSTVYLFVQKNREDIPSSQKIREILPQYLKLSDSLFSVADEPLLIHRTARGKPFLPQFPDLHLYKYVHFVQITSLTAPPPVIRDTM